MKKRIVAVGVVLSVVLFASCMRKSPEEAVKNFYTHLYKMEYDKVQTYVLPQHHHYYGFMVELMKHVPAAEREKAAKTEVEVLDIKCSVLGDTAAICSCLVKVEGLEIENNDLILKKIGKFWFVDKGMENKSFDEEEDLPLPDFDMDEDEDEPAEIESVDETIFENS